jgi:hypothetical protein
MRHPEPAAAADTGQVRLPAGGTSAPLGDLSYLLARSARWHARRAIASFASQDLDELLQAGTSAGTAVELLAKAYLATINPSLLADRGDRDTLLLLCGSSAAVNLNALSMRTIGAETALRLVQHVHAAFPPFEQQPLVLRVRNAAVHMALIDKAELRGAVLQMSRMTESLLTELGVDRDHFWGDHGKPVVNSLLDAARTALQHAVAAKMAAAGERLNRLTQDAPPRARAAILAALSGRLTGSSDFDAPRACPVCAQQAWLICSIEQEGTVRYKISENATPLAETDLVAYPFVFECPVCELQLDVDELPEFDFPRSIELGTGYYTPRPDEDDDR